MWLVIRASATRGAAVIERVCRTRWNAGSGDVIDVDDVRAAGPLITDLGWRRTEIDGHGTFTDAKLSPSGALIRSTC